ncbi:MAG: DUF4976 domain-containing protein, partial [Planctomycetes bacterium]|nr:DUF4976 domain-containing protein [Planctomycetota bacterium]
KTPDYMQGRSFKSILETGREPDGWKKAAYYHYWMHMAHHDNPSHIAIRTKRYKLILFYATAIKSSEPDTPPAWEFYDLGRDPGEMNNQYDSPEYAEVIAKLKKELKALRAKYKEDDPKFAFNEAIDRFWDYDKEDYKDAIKISRAMAGKD